MGGAGRGQSAATPTLRAPRSPLATCGRERHRLGETPGKPLGGEGVGPGVKIDRALIQSSREKGTGRRGEAAEAGGGS